VKPLKHVAGLLAAALAFTVTPLTSEAADAGAAFRVLVFSKTLGYRHASIPDGIRALRELGRVNGFAVDATEDSGAITPANLLSYRVVVFLSVTGNVLDPDQQAAFKSYVLNGGGFAAIHGAIFGPLACEDQWAWYGEMFCCAFKNHSGIVPATVDIEDPTHPSTADLPIRWQRTDEWYNFNGTPRGRAHVLATVDESTYSGGSMGGDHPIAWCRTVGKGRMWYTAMGHTESSFGEPLFLRHLLGGIRYVAGIQPPGGIPTPESHASLAWKREAGAVALLQGLHVVWQFNFGSGATKPYFHPMALPGGPVLTWDRPPDHRWHHALWFSWKFINGVNYWEEDPKTGLAQGRTTWREPQIEMRPDFSARIVMDLSYRPEANAQPVLNERRAIEISPPDKDGAYRQDWAMTFTAGDKDVILDRTPLPGEPGGQSWGGYAGLSVRLSPEISDPRATTTSGPVEFTDGRFRGTATAADYSGSFGAREAGIAILDRPSNLNSPSPWYVISEIPMHYFSPAVICYQPHTLKARQLMSLRYRVIVHPARWSEEQLRQASEHYTTEGP
jgi:type 1 glutamine amidotransferase